MTRPAPQQGLMIPEPRRAEPDPHPSDVAVSRSVRDEPGWVTLIEALDQTVAGIVAHLEHQLCHADQLGAARLRHQLHQARTLEAVTAAAAHRARSAPTPSTPTTPSTPSR